MDQRKAREKELTDLKRRVNEELASMKFAKFQEITDRDFEEATGVSRASLPGVEGGTSWPRLDTMYLWVTGCGSSLQDLFRAPSGEYGDDTREFHRNLEFILKTDPDHWLAQAIRSEFGRLKPPPRNISQTKRETPATPKPKQTKAS